MLKQTVIRSIGWVGCASIIIYGINAFTKILLARLLFPEDFGLFAIALILINFLTMFIGLGIGDVIIVSKNDFDKNANTGLVLTFVLGILLFLISFFSARAIATFFGNPTLILLVRILSIMFLFDSVTVIFRSILMRNLNFIRKSSIEIVSVLFYGIVVVGLAFAGYGVWSIVWASLIQHFLMMILFFAFCPWKPSFSFDFKTAKDLFHLGSQFF